ncbi:Copia protein, partial [Melipona quadrifasciata]
GIVLELSRPVTPQCNRIAERTNRTIIETTRTMLSDADLNLKFWGEAANTGVYIRNIVKCRVHEKTPYEICFNKVPNIQHMRRFGCAAYVLNKGKVEIKFESITVKRIFIGYNGNKTYRVYIPERESTKCDCHVKFDEERNGRDLLRHEESKNDDDDENDNLITVGLVMENKEDESEDIEVFDREENNVNFREEGTVWGGEMNNDYNGDEMDVNNQGMNISSEEPDTSRKRGRKTGTTTGEIRVRKYLRVQEKKKLV